MQLALQEVIRHRFVLVCARHRISSSGKLHHRDVHLTFRATVDYCKLVLLKTELEHYLKITCSLKSNASHYLFDI